MNKLLSIIGVFLILTGMPSPTLAYEKEAGEAAKLATPAATQIPTPQDIRVKKLQGYLEKWNSPMSGEAETFVREADKNGLDWRLLPAIAGVESGFGKHIPPGSYNAYGWAVFTGMSYGAAFKSWEDGITIVSQGLKDNYIDDGLTTIESIGYRYAASPVWASRVRYFMNEISAFVPEDTPNDLLAMTL